MAKNPARVTLRAWRTKSSLSPLSLSLGKINTINGIYFLLVLSSPKLDPFSTKDEFQIANCLPSWLLIRKSTPCATVSFSQRQREKIIMRSGGAFLFRWRKCHLNNNRFPLKLLIAKLIWNFVEISKGRLRHWVLLTGAALNRCLQYKVGHTEKRNFFQQHQICNENNGWRWEKQSSHREKKCSLWWKIAPHALFRAAAAKWME